MSEHSTADLTEDDRVDEAADAPPAEGSVAVDAGTADADAPGDAGVGGGEAADAAAVGSDEESDEAGTDESGAPRLSRIQRLEQEGEIAADYLEELLDIADLDGDLDIDVDGDRAAVSVVGADLSQLVGQRGEVLDALQELTRLAVYRETGERSRLMLDISGHRADRRSVLEELAKETIAEVQKSGEPASLKPMSPFERKVVHDAVAAAGLVSESEGAEPRRYVVILPSD